MNKTELLRRVTYCNGKFEVKGVRLHKDRNYGLDTQTYSLWLVGEHSVDESIVMGVDVMPLGLKFRSIDKAMKERDKFNRWVNSTNC